jgi:hypothetical protein
MDAIVEAALRKWPNVPACHGWLALDARGDWYMRDDRVQAAGPFPRVKGSRIEHDKLIAFIERNYARDDGSGAWFFQNGPQRVYVELEAAPWIWRVDAQFALTTHTGLAASARSCWLDEHGRLFVDSERGLGLVHTQDMLHAAQAVESGVWQPQNARFEALAGRFGHLLSPQAAAQRGGAEGNAVT